MDNLPAYLNANQKHWDQNTEVHLESAFYDLPGFRNGKSALNPIELKLLGEVAGKKILHLQCHFGQDTLSLARMGAEVTGVDLSEKAILAARSLAEELQLSARFIQSDVFQLDQVLDENFDIVFTSYGVIGWLPELRSWARIIDHFLKPEGKLIFVEFHPVVWLFDDHFEKIVYSYFNIGPIVEETEGTYADRSAPVTSTSYSWSHTFADIFSALLDRGLRITHFEEYDYSPYNCFNNTVKVENGYQIEGLEGKLPMVFSMVADKA